ncbi:MAG: DNA polymerase III subunit delta' [Brevefilum sp.]
MAWNIHAQDWAVSLLKSHAAGDKLRHAYLITGPEGVGRQTLAVNFAQALNCTNPPQPGEFCGNCRDCRQLADLTHPDLSLLLPVEDHKDILIDQVRALQHTLALSPYSGAYRIALLPDFQRATKSAANALLKTLEEPPDRVILLLTATAPEVLLPTVVSRCEVIRLRPASIQATQAYLHAQRGLDADRARLLAHISGGRIGAAIRMAEDPAALQERRSYLDELLALLPIKHYLRFKRIERFSKSIDKSRQKLGEIFPVWQSFWRDVFLRAAGESLPLVNVDLEAQIGQVAAQVTAERARDLVIAHQAAIQHLDANANIQLLLETLVLQWPLVAVQPAEEDVLLKVEMD